MPTIGSILGNLGVLTGWMFGVLKAGRASFVCGWRRRGFRLVLMAGTGDCADVNDQGRSTHYNIHFNTTNCSLDCADVGCTGGAGRKCI